MSATSFGFSPELERAAAVAAQCALEQLAVKHLSPMHTEIGELKAELRVLNAFIRGNGNKGLITRFDDLVEKLDRFVTREEFDKAQANYREDLRKSRDEERHTRSFLDWLKGAKWAVVSLFSLLLSLVAFLSHFIH